MKPAVGVTVLPLLVAENDRPNNFEKRSSAMLQIHPQYGFRTIGLRYPTALCFTFFAPLHRSLVSTLKKREKHGSNRYCDTDRSARSAQISRKLMCELRSVRATLWRRRKRRRRLQCSACKTPGMVAIGTDTIAKGSELNAFPSSERSTALISTSSTFVHATLTRCR